MLIHVATRIARGDGAHIAFEKESNKSAYHCDMADSSDNIWNEDDFGVPLPSSTLLKHGALANVKSSDPLSELD
jgi:hypothetical protein